MTFKDRNDQSNGLVFSHIFVLYIDFLVCDLKLCLSENDALNI